MPSTNETKVTTNELNSDGKDATENSGETLGFPTWMLGVWSS